MPTLKHLILPLALLASATLLPVEAAATMAPSPGPGMTDADYSKVFTELAADMRDNFRSSNKCTGGSSCLWWFPMWQANEAQRDKIAELKLIGQKIQTEEARKKKAASKPPAPYVNEGPQNGGSLADVIANGDGGGGGGGGFTGGGGYGDYSAGIRSALRYAAIVEQTWVDGLHVGNCGEMAPVAFARMYNMFPEVEFNLVSNKDGDHAFVLGRLPSGDTYVIDPWRGTSSGPYLYSKGKLYERGTTTRASGYDFDFVTHTDPDAHSNDVDAGWVSRATHGSGFGGGARTGGESKAPSKPSKAGHQPAPRGK